VVVVVAKLTKGAAAIKGRRVAMHARGIHQNFRWEGGEGKAVPRWFMELA